MEEIMKDLDRLAKEIEEGKKNKALNEGRIKELLKQLNGFGLTSLEEAVQTIEEMEKELKTEEEEIHKEHQSLKSSYQW